MVKSVETELPTTRSSSDAIVKGGKEGEATTCLNTSSETLLGVDLQWHDNHNNFKKSSSQHKPTDIL
jgi:hypothetical protein